MKFVFLIIFLTFSSAALAQNDAPVLGYIFDQPLYFDGVQIFDDIVVTATDVNGDTLTFSESGRPPYCGFM